MDDRSSLETDQHHGEESCGFHIPWHHLSLGCFACTIHPCAFIVLSSSRMYVCILSVTALFFDFQTAVRKVRSATCRLVLTR
jgi:hypothetical protein